LPYQLRVARDYGLRFVFFVEALFACEFGLTPLSEIVHMIREAGQEVQLHAHPEWVRHSTNPLFDTGDRYVFRQFSEEEQLRLIEVARSNLSAAGAGEVNAFRAGSFAADHRTLRAVNRAGLEVDSSLKLGTTLGNGFGLVDRCCRIDGVKEYPLSVFEDWPGHRRHLQIGSCSSRELAHVIRRARHQGWKSVVVLSHSVEMMNRHRTGPDEIVRRRFERFCQFLADSAAEVKTSWFSSEQGSPFPDAPMASVQSPRWSTVLRQGEQALRRLLP
jgi:hypothetical protein